MTVESSNPPSNESEVQTPPISNDPSPNTPPNNNSEGRPSPEVLALIREANEARRRAEERAENIERQVRDAANAPAAIVDDPEAFIKNPQSEMSKMVKREIDQTMRPVLDFVQNFQRNTAIGQLKNKVLDDNLPAHFKPAREQFFNALDSEIIGDSTYDSVRAAFYIVLGKAVSQYQPTNSPVSSNVPPNNQNTVTPPPTIPNSPTPPRQENGLRALSEQEEFARKQWGMSKEEFLAELGETNGPNYGSSINVAYTPVNK